MAAIVHKSRPNDPFPTLPIPMPTSVLFICNFNAVRSPMAEALTKFYCGHRIFIQSIGIRAEATKANPFAQTVMEEIGLDISGHHPHRYEDLMDKSFDLMITLSPEAQHRAMDLTRTLNCQVEYWPTVDPTVITGNRQIVLSAYRQTREMLIEKIKHRFEVEYFPTA